MQNVLDQLAKAILKALLDHVAQLETNREIRGHVLAADLWVQPDPARSDDLQALGVLGRMIAWGPCLIEPFSDAPRASQVRSCILKQYSLNHAQKREARTQGTPAPLFPRLWIIAAGSPDGVIKAMKLSEMKDWPNGFLCGDPFDRFHIVVVPRLPRTPETLFIRLLSRGDTFRDAAQELATAPHTAHELARRVMQVLVVFSKDLNQDHLEEKDMEALRDIEAAYNEWERQVEAKATIKNIHALCRRCEIELSDERLSQLAKWSTEELEKVLVELGATHEWPTTI